MLHNRYRQPGGEERSVAAIASLLSERGHAVTMLERSSADLRGARGRARAAEAMIAGGVDAGDVRAAVMRESGALPGRPLVAHAHNIHPLLGVRALAAARNAGARVVMHVHNYRLFCAVAISYRAGAPCMRCHGRNTLPGLLLRCRGGLAEPAVYAAGLALHQGRLLELVDRFVAPSRAAAEHLECFGMPPERLDVLHNFVPADELAPESTAHTGQYALFAGRLAEEKGADTAIEASRRSGVPLVIAGDGPDEARLRRLGSGAPVEFAGRLSASELTRARGQAAFALLPSRWDEPCPYAAIEAMAAGLPVLASSMGGLPELVEAENVLDPREPQDWADAISELWSDSERRRELGEQALSRARDLFGPDRFYSGLMDVYSRAGAWE